MKRRTHFFPLFFLILFSTTKGWGGEDFSSFFPTFQSKTNGNTSASLQIYKPRADKELIYVGTSHTNDFQSSVATTIKSLIESEKPSLCILEGFESAEGINPQRIIQLADEKCAAGKCMENLYGVYLCHQNHIDFMGGEPPEQEYMPSLKSFEFSQQDFVFFLLAQQIPFWHLEGNFQSQDLKSQFETFMKDQISPLLKIPAVTYSYEDFLKWHQQHMGKPYDPQHDFLWPLNNLDLSPYLGADATIYQKIAARFVVLRDQHLLEVIQQAMADHSKVLVIYGEGHLENESKALQHLFGNVIEEREIK